MSGVEHASIESLPHGGGADVAARGFGWRHGSRKNPTLVDVTFDIPAGQKVLLLGESGAGKSTLLAGIAGVLGSAEDGDYSGSITVGGLDPRAQRGIVGLVLQDPDSQVISARVGDDVVFGCENLGVERETMWQRARDAVAMVGLTVPLWHSTAKLSGGQKQRLALAGVIAMGARVIALDEPTANLDPEGVVEVRDAIIAAANATGATVIVVEHRVDVWADVVDRAIVLGADGTITADGPVADVIRDHGDRLAADGVWIPGHDPHLPAAQPAAVEIQPDVWTRELITGWEKDQPIGVPRSVALPGGKSTVITGANGAGKTTLALTMAGLLAPLGGDVVAAERVAAGAGTNPHSWSSRELSARIGFVFQDPEHQFVARTVREELEIGPKVLAGTGKRTLLGATTGTIRPQDAARIDELLQRLRLEHLAAANPFTLSGGQKRRLSVATALVTSPHVVILDEPTFGQDRRTFTEMITLLRELSDSGVTLASVTHDPLFIRALGDHHVEVTPS